MFRSRTLVAFFLFLATAQLTPARVLGEPIALQNHGLLAKVDTRTGGITEVTNRLTQEAYKVRAYPFSIETDGGILTAGAPASYRRLEDGIELTYEAGPARIKVNYQLNPDHDFLQKVIEIENLGNSPLAIHRVEMDQFQFSPSFATIRPHYDPSQFRWLINLFLEGKAGGFFMGVENPVYTYWTKGMTPGNSWVQTEYCPATILQPQESYTSDPSFLGAFRKEHIYLFKELGKLQQAMEAPNAINTALNFDQEILDWGEVWAMQDMMRAIQPPHEFEKPGFYVRAVGYVGGLHPGAGFFTPFAPDKIQGSKEFVDQVAQLGHVQHLEWATEWFGVGSYGNPTQDFVLENPGPGDPVPVNPNWLDVVKYGWQKDIQTGIFETVGRDFARHEDKWKVLRADGTPWVWGKPAQPVNCWGDREYVKWRLEVTDQAVRNYHLYMVAWDSIVPADWAWLGWPALHTECFAKDHGHPPGDIRYAIYRNITWFLEELQKRHPKLALRVASGLTTDYPWALKNLIEYHPDFYDGETGASFWTSYNFRFLPIYKSGILLSATSKTNFEWLLLRSISLSDHFMLWGDAVPIALQDRPFWTKWLNWADQNLDYLHVGRTLFREPWGDRIVASLPPNLEGRLPASSAHLHGSAHCIRDRGYLFLFNPSAAARVGVIPLNHWIGLTQGQKFSIGILHPDGNQRYGPYQLGDELKIEVPAGGDMVLQILPANEQPANGKPIASGAATPHHSSNW